MDLPSNFFSGEARCPNCGQNKSDHIPGEVCFANMNMAPTLPDQLEMSDAAMSFGNDDPASLAPPSFGLPTDSTSFSQPIFSDTTSRGLPWLASAPDPYICTVCSKAFNTSWQLEAHAKSEKHATYVCSHPSCDCSYYRRDSYSRHIASHRGPFACEICQKQAILQLFETKEQLYRHRKAAHPKAARPSDSSPVKTAQRRQSAQSYNPPGPDTFGAPLAYPQHSIPRASGYPEHSVPAASGYFCPSVPVIPESSRLNSSTQASLLTDEQITLLKAAVGLQDAPPFSPAEHIAQPEPAKPPGQLAYEARLRALREAVEPQDLPSPLTAE